MVTFTNCHHFQRGANLYQSSKVYIRENESSGTEFIVIKIGRKCCHVRNTRQHTDNPTLSHDHQRGLITTTHPRGRKYFKYYPLGLGYYYGIYPLKVEEDQLEIRTGNIWNLLRIEA